MNYPVSGTKTCPVCRQATTDPRALYCPSDGALLVALPPNDPIAGGVLHGKYRIGRMLGEGGMGRVYEARHITMDRRCAIKVLRPELLYDADSVVRFRREAVATGALDHPNIVTVFDVDQTPEGVAYIVMEFLEGEDLRTHLRRTPILPLGRCAHIFDQICNAVAAAHARGIIHRDLKPENIVLVRRDADADHVKVLDFGISKLAGPGPKVTRTGMMVGTPQYMSPEQAHGRPDVDARTDVYAIGAMLYKALTGRTPFTGATTAEVLARLLTEVPPPPRQINPAIPPVVEAVILRAIAHDPAERFATCAEMRAALHSAMSQVAPCVEPTLPATPGPGIAPVPQVQAGVLATAPDSPFARYQTPAASRAFSPAPPGGVAVPPPAGVPIATTADRSAAAPTWTARLEAILPWARLSGRARRAILVGLAVTVAGWSWC